MGKSGHRSYLLGVIVLFQRDMPEGHLPPGNGPILPLYAVSVDTSKVSKRYQPKVRRAASPQAAGYSYSRSTSRKAWPKRASLLSPTPLTSSKASSLSG